MTPSLSQLRTAAGRACCAAYVDPGVETCLGAARAVRAVWEALDPSNPERDSWRITMLCWTARAVREAS